MAMRMRLVAAGLAALLPAGCIHAEDAADRAADRSGRETQTAPREPPAGPPSVPTTPEHARTVPVPEPRSLEPPTTVAPRRTPLLIGFYDDASFRWRPYRRAMLDAAQIAGARIIRATVYWDRVAPVRPRRPTAPLDPAYRLEDLDELGHGARRRGIELLLTIWGTPRWANGDRPRNRAPLRPADLGAFAQALAGRYSGRLPGFPRVRYFSIWNEPNRELFLAPQFDAQGRSVAPAVYARLARAAYAGIKRGNPSAVVAIGETAAYGRDRPTTAQVQDSHSPGRFAYLVARARPRVPLDAWAHHPYPTAPHLPPTQRVRWPNVTFSQLLRFESALDRWFGRTGLPLWISEYAHETRPQEPLGVSPDAQANYAREALALAASDPRVRMFVWFTFRDDPTNTWQSGLLTRSGARRPAYEAFAAAARSVRKR